MALKDKLGRDSRTIPGSVKKLPKLITDGVTEDDIRTMVTTIKEKLLVKYNRLDTAFKNIDEDRSGFLTKVEFLFLLKMLNLDTQFKPVVTNCLVDLMDDDGDGQINHQEFVCVLSLLFFFEPCILGPLCILTGTICA